MLYLTVEIMLLLEDMLHGIDHRAAEKEDAVSLPGRAHLGEELLHGLEDAFAVLGIFDILEFVYDHYDLDIPVGREKEWKTEDSGNVIVIYIPVE